jgi:hypothetical protein
VIVENAPAWTLALAIGAWVPASVTVPDSVPWGPGVQLGNLKFPIRVRQLKELVAE